MSTSEAHKITSNVIESRRETIAHPNYSWVCSYVRQNVVVTTGYDHVLANAATDHARKVVGHGRTMPR